MECDATYPAIVICMQDPNELAGLDFEFILHGRLEVELDTVDIVRSRSSRSTRSSVGSRSLGFAGRGGSGGGSNCGSSTGNKSDGNGTTDLGAWRSTRSAWSRLW
jgi:hypothetical protein